MRTPYLALLGCTGCLTIDPFAEDRAFATVDEMGGVTLVANNNGVDVVKVHFSNTLGGVNFPDQITVSSDEIGDVELLSTEGTDPLLGIAIGATAINARLTGNTVSIEEFLPEESFIGSRLIWLPFGDHVVVVSAEGHAQQRVTVETRSNIQRSVRVELERTPVLDLPPPPPPPRRPSPWLRPALVTAGALGAIGGAAYLWARKRANDAGEITLTGAREDYDALVRSAHRWQYVAWGSTVAAVLAAGAASVLWFRVRRGSVAIVPTGTTATASLTLAF